MIDAATYATERAICDKAESYARATMAARGKNCCYITKEEAQHPDYVACDNAMRGRVELYEIMRDKPAALCAYVHSPEIDKRGHADVKITTWMGDEIGRGTLRSTWLANGTRMYSGRCIIADDRGAKRYSWRGQGHGMIATLKAIRTTT